MDYPVKCKNCGLKWLYVSPDYDGITIPALIDVQTLCPNCNSNWYERIDDTEGKERLEE